ncbi:MAG: PEP-CTERM sorting domain-containing protein [Deltaproteobacteria bacterium]|nr:PEP-CTERM sorting domain-containing protein [Deltaproteobacteria bacterium]
MKKKLLLTVFAVCFFVVSVACNNSFATSLIGDSVGATIINNDTSGYYLEPSPFSSPQVVGSGAEFTSWLQNDFGPGTYLDLDIRGDGFDIIFRDHTPSNLAASFSRNYRIDLYDLDPSLNSDIVAMSFNGGFPVLDWGYSPDTAYVQLEGYRTNTTLSFDFEYSPVPVPATMLLFGTGLAGLAVSRISRKKKAQ